MSHPNAEVVPQQTTECLLTSGAVEFLNALHRRFARAGGRVQEILAARALRQEQFDQGDFPDFPLRQTARQSEDWMVELVPAGLSRRQALVVVPPEQAALRRGLDSEATIVVADFDDRASHAWASCIQAHVDLRAAIERRIQAQDEGQCQPALVVRPRSWGLEEKHFVFHQSAIPAALFDFGLYTYHWAAAKASVAAKGELFFSLAKLESPEEACLWRDIFFFAEYYFGFPEGSIRAIVTIETVSAVFEMDEILSELLPYVCGLECSLSNYLASFAKTFRAHGESLLPQRNDVAAGQPFLRAYQELLVHTCERRGVLALSGGPSQLPTRDDSGRNQWTRARVRLSAKDEIEMGFDGISVADADLVPVVLSAFREHRHKPTRTIPAAKQCYITSQDLICRARGRITLAGLGENVTLTIGFLEAWLSGRGSMRLADDMPTMATAELCRAQLWQWIRHSARLQSGRRVNRQLLECLVRDQLTAIECSIGAAEFATSKFRPAADLLLSACTDAFDSPLAVRAYARLG